MTTSLQRMLWLLGAAIIVIGIFEVLSMISLRAEAATNAVPSIVALYEDTLASAISSSATSFTLTRGTDKVGTSLASSTYPFIIDEGTASEEMVLADCTGTTCTNISRGISPVSGTTTVTALKKTHRRGASVKITDGPQLNIISRIVNGIGTLPNPLLYTSSPTFTATNQLVDKNYVDALAFSGAAVISATEAAKGVAELATALEQASSTITGSSGPLVMQSRYATDTPQAGCASGYSTIAGAGCSIIASLTGKIKQTWIDLTATWTVTGAWIFGGTATFNGATALNATTTVSSTISANVPVILVSTSTPAVVSSNAATQTAWQYVIPANTLGKNDTFRLHAAMKDIGGCGAFSVGKLLYGNGSATTTIASTTMPTQTLVLNGTISNQGATNAQYGYFDTSTTTGTGTTAVSIYPVFFTSAYDTTAKTYLALTYFCTNGSTAALENMTIEKLSSQ